MKKILSLILAITAIVGVFSLTSCSVKPEKDWENIKKDGKFIVGCTDMAPMNYYAEDGKTLIGFDTEYAQAVADYLGVKVEFQMITWNQKYMELEGGKIDCIWNGFTANSSDDGVARADKVDFPTYYATNYQCIVMKAGTAFTDLASLNGKTCAVEGGSAGEDYAKTLTGADKIIPKDVQMDAFTELKAGTVDFIVVDVLLAKQICGKGDYANLSIGYHNVVNAEFYGIGCRKGSSFTAKIQEATVHLVKTGKLQALAVKYDVTLSPQVLALAAQ